MEMINEVKIIALDFNLCPMSALKRKKATLGYMEAMLKLEAHWTWNLVSSVSFSMGTDTLRNLYFQ